MSSLHFLVFNVCLNTGQGHTYASLCTQVDARHKQLQAECTDTQLSALGCCQCQGGLLRTSILPRGRGRGRGLWQKRISWRANYRCQVWAAMFKKTKSHARDKEMDQEQEVREVEGWQADGGNCREETKRGIYHHSHAALDHSLFCEVDNGSQGYRV